MNKPIVVGFDTDVVSTLFQEYFKCEKYEFVLHDGFTPIPNEITSSKQKKIALVSYLRLNPFMDFKINCKFDLCWADLVICYTSEPQWGRLSKSLNEQLEILRVNFNNKNIKLITGVYYLEEKLRKVKNHFYWNSIIQEVENSNKNISFNYTNKRKYKFDCLLGIAVPHKIKIFEALKSNNLLEQSLVSIRNHPDTKNVPIENYESPELILFERDEIIKEKNSPEFTLTSKINSEDRTFYVCTSISPKIYENSWFSITIETFFTDILYNEKSLDDFYLLNEKVLKCFVGKRVFISFGKPYNLKYLKIFGFKTFDGIIDESYDLEENHDKRFNMIVEQIIWLSKQNPIKIYEKAMPILEHNYNQVKILRKENENKLLEFLDKII